MENTSFKYCYQPSNKNPEKALEGEVILSGWIGLDKPNIKTKIERCLEDGQYFIASQLNIPELFPWKLPSEHPSFHAPTNEDHCWHKFSDINPSSNSPTDHRTMQEFLDGLKRADRDGWKVFDPYYSKS
jgi:hypothetical protein